MGKKKKKSLSQTSYVWKDAIWINGWQFALHIIYSFCVPIYNSNSKNQHQLCSYCFKISFAAACISLNLVWSIIATEKKKKVVL